MSPIRIEGSSIAGVVGVFVICPNNMPKEQNKITEAIEKIRQRMREANPYQVGREQFESLMITSWLILESLGVNIDKIEGHELDWIHGRFEL